MGAFEYTPPKTPNDVATRAHLEAQTFKPNTKHAIYCAMREIPKGLRGDNRCSCNQSPTSKALTKLRCSGFLVEPPHFPSTRKARHALLVKPRPFTSTKVYACRCGQIYYAGSRDTAREEHRLHLKARA